jgi:hypothetical protein
MRRYTSPRRVMPARLFLPPLEFCFGVKPSQPVLCQIDAYGYDCHDFPSLVS